MNSKKCSFLGCRNQVEISCECKENPFHCVEHFVIHLKKKGNHLIYSRFMELKPELSKKILKELNQKHNQLLLCKKELKKFCHEITSFIVSTCKTLSESLSSEIKNYNLMKKLLLERGEVDRDAYTYLTSSATSQVSIPQNFDGLKTAFEEFLADNYKLVEGVKEDDEYFWLYENELFKIDLKTLKKSANAISSSITSSLNSCKLPDCSFFVNPVGTTDCYFVDLDESTITQIESCPVTTYYGVLACINECIYMINGYSSPMSEKFDLKSKEWSKISSCPLVQHVNTGGSISNRICLTCYYQSSAYVYDPTSDSYTKILSLNKGYKIVGHGYILTSKVIYKCEDAEGMKWESLSYRTKDSDCCYCMMNTYVCKREKYLYFCNCSQKLFRFDTKLLEYKMISLV